MGNKFALIKGYLLLAVLLAVYIVFAKLTYKNYGITADEYSAYISGDIWYHHYLNFAGPNDFLVRYNPIISEHNRIYPTILYAITQSLNYDMYHFLNFIFTAPVFICAFIFIWKYYKKIWAGGLIVMLMFLTPRFIGDIPANPKDIPFAVAYLISVILIFLSTNDFFKKYQYLKIILLGGLLGYAQSIRAIGFTLYPVLFIWTLLNTQEKRKSFINIGLETVATFLISLFVMCVIWPAIGYNFFANFKKYAVLSSDYTLWDGNTLFNGVKLTSANIPFYYMPVWIFITTPIVYILLTLAGLVIAFKKLSSPLLKFSAALIAYNFIIYFIVRPVSYNGIRHFLFLVLFITFFSGIVLIEILQKVSPKKGILLLSVIGIYLVFTFYKMYQLFPYQYTYFNEVMLSYSNAATKFDSDYWGASYKEAADKIKEIAKSNQSVPLQYYTCKMGTPMHYYLDGIATQVEQPIHADYIVCNAEEIHDKKLDVTLVSAVSRLGYIYESVYKRNPKVSSTLYKGH